MLHSSNTFSAHFVDLSVLTGIKPFESFSSVSSSVNSKRSQDGRCGSLLLVAGRWGWL